MREEDLLLEQLLIEGRDPNLKKEKKATLLENIEKGRIRSQAYLRQFHCRHNIIEDFGEVIFAAYDRFFQLEKEIQ